MISEYHIMQMVFETYINDDTLLYALLLVKKQHYQCGIEMIRRDLLTGHWKPYLLRALTLQPCYDGPINGGEVIYFLFPGASFVSVICQLN
jgi:L-arabinokinase